MKHLFLLSFLLLSVYSAEAKKTTDGWPASITPISAKYIPATRMKHLVDSLLEVTVTANGMPAEEFANRYPQYKKEFYRRMAMDLEIFFTPDERIYDYDKPRIAAAEFANGNMESQYRSDIVKSIEQEFTAVDHYLSDLASYSQPERIISFNSRVNVEKNGLVKVDEVIQIYTGGREEDHIKHGLIRTFPVDYKHSSGFMSSVPFKVTAATLDGKHVHLEMKKNGGEENLYVGDPDYEIPAGVHFFQITYTTDQQIRHYNDYDEVAWNVTGSKWHFPIENATCEVNLPNGVQIHNTNCHTGISGSTETACSFETPKANQYVFRSTRPLQPGEGLTVAISFNKGLVAPTSFTGNLVHFTQDNSVFIWLLIFVFVQLFIFAYVFNRFKSGKSGPITPLYSPPAGLSAPEIGYIAAQAFTDGLFPAAMVEATINGYVTMTVTKGAGDKNTYSLRKADHATGRSSAFAKSPGGPSPARINSFSQAIADVCPVDIVIGTHSAPVAALNEQLKKSLAIYKTFNPTIKWPKYLSLALCILACLVGLACLTQVNGVVFGVVIFLIVASVLAHIKLTQQLKNYKPANSDLENQVAGFKLYLSATDGQRRNFPNAPELSTALYEKYLPYAIALGLENAWGIMFKNTITSALANNSYTPTISYVGWGAPNIYHDYYHNSLFHSYMAGALYSSMYNNNGYGYASTFGGNTASTSSYQSSNVDTSSSVDTSTDYSSDSSSFSSDSYSGSSDDDSGSSDDGGGGGGGDGF